MEFKKLALIVGGVMLCLVATTNVEGRTQYKKVLEKLETPTEAEEALQKSIADNKCNACHVDGEKKKVRNEYGEKLRAALGGDDYEFDKKAWKKDKETKQYSKDVIKMLRDAIKKAAE